MGLVPVAGCHPVLKITDKWMYRKYSRHPYDAWHPVHPCAVVEVRNIFGEPKIGVAHQFDWRYETDVGIIAETAIMRARQVFKNGKPLFRVRARSV